MAAIDAVKMFMGRFIITREELPEFRGLYEHVDNQGNTYPWAAQKNITIHL